MPREKSPIAVESLKHRDKRTNIPTEELRDFVKAEEKSPKMLLYPRNPELDPQLVWKGKDEQDRTPLAVPAVPVYIQEKIHPRAIIEEVRAEAQRQDKKAATTQQPDLFGDFNGITFEDQVDFYHHEQNWSNRMILGDSLLVMNSLAEKEGLRGMVQMIYIDPPYGIKFNSNWQVSTRKRDIVDGRADDTTRQPEQIKAFRDTWKLGIHSYLAYLRDRLVVARELLTDSGSVFVQIGDENVHLVRCVLDEVFGTENFCSQIVFRKTTGKGSALLDNTYDVLLWYAKRIEAIKIHKVYQTRDFAEDINFRFFEEPTGRRRPLSDDEIEKPSQLPPLGRVYRHNPLTSQSGSSTTVFEYVHAGNPYRPTSGGWKTNLEGMRNLALAARLTGSGKTLSFIRYFEDFPFQEVNDIWDDTRQSGFGDPKIYVVQTATRVAERCLLLTTDPGDLVLDPTCGSGTTAYVAEQRGRRWITVDTSRVALALARTRLMAARFPYYVLADSPEGMRQEATASGRAPHDGKTEGDLRKGFVYKRVPHIMLKDIANNADIDAIHARWQETLEPLRAKLNQTLKQKWEEWEIPREADDKWSDAAKKSHAEWWAGRRRRQQEIDASIARNASQELLYDQPYTDNKKVRVTGPFTMESLSPHRVLSADEERPRTEREGQRDGGGGGFERMILDNLKAAGVQNREKKERLKFDRIDPYPGQWIHAEGEYQESGKPRRAAICIGPEHGTVGADTIKEAAKEAVQGTGFDLLIVCGFAFDPHVSEEAKRYGKLTVLITRMNPDLTMGEDYLKKTGTGNLFMVFGEPDLAVRKRRDGKLEVEIKGVDVYDPTTGQIRSHTTDDIATWFIDTRYNGESFFVRHAYFCGGQEPYDSLKRALRAEIDEAAWSALYQTTSLPFDPPATGKIAVKVINHYGDEVLKVYEVR